MTPVRVVRSTVVDALAEDVWRLLRDFNAHEAWHPAVASSRIEAGEEPDRIGAVRAFRLQDGGFLREQLIALSDRDMSLTYCLLEAPVSLFGYVATIQVRRVTDGERAYVRWESGFEAPPGEAGALERLVAEDIYERGFAALRARLSRPPAPGSLAGSLTPALAAARFPRFAASAGADRAGVLRAEAMVVEHHGGPEMLMRRIVDVPPPGRRKSGSAMAPSGSIWLTFMDEPEPSACPICRPYPAWKRPAPCSMPVPG